MSAELWAAPPRNRHSVVYKRTCALALASMAMSLGACNKEKPEVTDAAPSIAEPAKPAASSRLSRDSTGHLSPHTQRPVDDPAQVPPAPSHDLDWDLDRNDPARDYVQRYIRATLRYGDKTSCVQAMPSVSASGGRTVEVKDARRDGCAAPSDAVRDRFRVSVGDDRLHLDGKDPQSPLKKWPDGSDPEGPPNPTREEDDVNGWSSKVKDALQASKLTTIRAQWYGRGSYLVVTAAGWYPPVVRGASPEALKPLAEKLCAAGGGLPLGVFAGIDRSMLLRFTCPDSARWEKL